MLINAEEEECRIAVIEDNQLEELYLERVSLASHVGNIYKGRVTNVEKSIQAAFIDFGLPKQGFLHVSDLHSQYFTIYFPISTVPNGASISIFFVIFPVQLEDPGLIRNLVPSTVDASVVSIVWNGSS